MRSFALTALLLAAPVALRAEAPAAPAAPPAAAEAPAEPKTLHDRMEIIGDTFRDLRTALRTPDAAKKADYVALARTLHAHAKASVDLVPASVAALPEAERAPLLAAYRAQMTKTVQDMEKLVAQLEQADFAAAGQTLRALNQLKNEGHEKFRVED